MNKVHYFLKKHSSTILTTIGAVGVIGTSVLAVKATPKALELINEAEEKKGEKLTKVEVVKVAWKPYIPAVVTGLSTITCIFGANHLSTKQQRSLMAAYTLLDNSFKQYRKKTEELYGEADTNIMQEIIGSEFDENMELNEDKLLFYEHHSRRFFESTMEEVMQAECAYLELLENRGYASLNEYYDLLGIPHIPHGYQLCWFDVEDVDPYDCHRLEFDYKKTMLKDKYECFVISTNMPPADDYVY